MCEIEPVLDAGEAFLNAIYPTGLTGNLGLKVPNLRHHVTHRALEPSNRALYDGHIGLQIIDHAANVAKVLKHDIAGFLCHGGGILACQFASRQIGSHLTPPRRRR